MYSWASFIVAGKCFAIYMDNGAPLRQSNLRVYVDQNNESDLQQSKEKVKKICGHFFMSRRKLLFRSLLFFCILFQTIVEKNKYVEKDFELHSFTAKWQRYDQTTRKMNPQKTITFTQALIQEVVKQLTFALCCSKSRRHHLFAKLRCTPPSCCSNEDEFMEEV